MNTTVIICVTVIICLAVLCITAFGVFGTIMRLKSQEVRESRIYMQNLLNQLYYNINKWIDRMYEELDK